VEVLIAMLVMSIVGGGVMGVLWFSFGAFFQLDDYTSANEEIDFAIQKLSREFTLVGLGMPNNRTGKGSFASAFAYVGGESPIMSLMGAPGSNWGGPVTITNANSADKYEATTLDGSGNWKTDPELGPGGAYVGAELYYAWGVPTGVKLIYPESSREKLDNVTVTVSADFLYSPVASVNAVEYLKNFVYDGREIGLTDSTPDGRNPSKWFLLPTIRVPLLLEELNAGGLKAWFAPNSAQSLQGARMGLDEIHLIQAARLYRNEDNELVQVIFGSDYTDASTNASSVLARNIVGLQFTYNPASRLLTMHIAARGSEGNSVSSGQTEDWPSWLGSLLSSDAAGRRVVVKSLSWRIRN
jgi:hypothetical protein